MGIETIVKTAKNFSKKLGLYTIGTAMLAMSCGGGSGKKEDPVDPCSKYTQEEIDDGNKCTENWHRRQTRNRCSCKNKYF